VNAVLYDGDAFFDILTKCIYHFFLDFLILLGLRQLPDCGIILLERPSALTLGPTIGLDGLIPSKLGITKPTFGGQPWGGFLLSLVVMIDVS